MKSIFLCIIGIYTIFLPSISFASTAKAFHYSHQVKISNNVSSNWFTEIVEIEEDDLPQFEFKNPILKQNTNKNGSFNSQELYKHSLKRVLYQNNLLHQPSPLFILHQFFSI